MTFNINDKVIIYPNKKGWDKLVQLNMNVYKQNHKTALSYIDRCRTDDDGFEEQLWIIMELYNGIFYNGSNYLATTHIELRDKVKMTSQELREYKLKDILDI